MFESNKKKKNPWKWTAGLLFIGLILFLWIKKDLLPVCHTMPKDEVLPVLASSVAVTLSKAALLVGVITLFKRLGGKLDSADNAS